MSIKLDTLDTLMTVTGATGGVATLDCAALSNHGLLAVCYRTFEKRQVNVAELYEVQTGRNLGRQKLGWPVLCNVTDEGAVFVGDREGDDEDHASDLVRFDGQTGDGAVTRLRMPMNRVSAMDVRPDGRFVCCSGLHAGDGFGPEDEDLWVLDVEDPHASWSRIPNPHKDPIIAVQWAERAGWVLSKAEVSEPSEGYELTLAVQVPGTREPLWQGSGRNAVVAGDRVILWVHDGNALEVWEPGQEEPLRRGVMRVEGKPHENPLSYTTLPHNMVAINGGQHVALLTLYGLWIVDTTTFDVVRRYPLGSWDSASVFSNRSGHHLACYSGARAKLWVLESKQLLMDPTTQEVTPGVAPTVTRGESRKPAIEVDLGTLTRTFSTEEGGRIEVDFPMGTHVVERVEQDGGIETVTSQYGTYDDALQGYLSRIEDLLANGCMELLASVTFKKGRSSVRIRPPVIPVLEAGDAKGVIEHHAFPCLLDALQAFNDRVLALQASGYKLSTKAWKWTGKSCPTTDQDVFELAKEGKSQYFRLSAKPGRQYGPTLSYDRTSKVRRLWMQVRDTKVGPNSWLKDDALHHIGIDSENLFLTFAPDNTIKRAAVGAESLTLVDGEWVRESRPGG